MSLSRSQLCPHFLGTCSDTVDEGGPLRLTLVFADLPQVLSNTPAVGGSLGSTGGQVQGVVGQPCLGLPDTFHGLSSLNAILK